MAQDATLADADIPSLTKDPKATADFSEQADELIAGIKEVVQAGGLPAAIERLMDLEKKARQACDGKTVSKLACAALSLYQVGNDYLQLFALMRKIAKKQGQLEKCIVSMVQLCLEWLAKVEMSGKVRTTFLETLAIVTDGQMCVEVERAEVMRMQAMDAEVAGDIKTAAMILQEVPIETFNRMERKEKTEYILEQMRLVLANDDNIRCGIISKKINPKLLEDAALEECKLLYYGYMVQYHMRDKRRREACQATEMLYRCSSVYNNDVAWKKYLESYAILAIITDSSRDRLLLRELTKISSDRKKLAEIPVVKQLVHSFLQNELLPTSVTADEVKELAFFAQFPDEWSAFETRCIQHNLVILSRYYSRIRLSRICQLLSLSPERAEEEICAVVNSKLVAAKIDRPADVVVFSEGSGPDFTLDRWAADVSKVVSYLEETDYLIQKEVSLQQTRQAQLDNESSKRASHRA